MPDGIDRIADDELLCRRIPAKTQWYTPERSAYPSPNFFKPHKENDHDGVCLTRVNSSIEAAAEEEAARGRDGVTYYVAFLRAIELRRLGLEPIPDPVEGNPGHCRIPSLNTAVRDDPETRVKIERVSRMCERILGPFECRRHGQ